MLLIILFILPLTLAEDEYHKAPVIERQLTGMGPSLNVYGAVFDNHEEGKRIFRNINRKTIKHGRRRKKERKSKKLPSDGFNPDIVEKNLFHTIDGRLWREDWAKNNMDELLLIILRGAKPTD